MEELYATLLDSEEFGLRGGDILKTLGRMYVDDVRIDADVDDRAMLEKLLDRVVGQWRLIGESETFWSVRPDEGFKKDKLDQTRIDDMYASGHFVKVLIEAFEAKAKTRIPRGRCFELGCGVGRETHVLAHMFDSVLATEISTGALRVCKDYLEQKRIRNVDLKQMTTLEDFRADAPYDLFYSSAVLEHSPPPVQKEILRASLALLKPGGFCIFNTPAYIHDYRFSVADYLSSKDEVFELHCLPTAETLRVLKEMDVEIIDFVPDGVLAQFGSMMYFGQRRAR